jgi:hypothetical protein
MSDKDERKRRGIQGAAQALRREVMKQGGRDPGQEAAARQVRTSVEKCDKKRDQRR